MSEYTNSLDKEKLIYKQVIQLNIAYNILIQPKISIYPKAFIRKKGDEFNYLKDAYINYYIKVPDNTTIKLCNAG